MNTTTVDFLKTLPLFKGLNNDELESISRCIRPILARPGEILFNQGDQGHGAYILRAGQLDVEFVLPDSSIHPLARLHAGRIVGEVCLIEPAPRSMRVRVWMTAELLFIDRVQFDALHQRGDSAAYKLIRNISLMYCGRLRATNKQLMGGLKEIRQERAEVPVSALQGAPPPPKTAWNRLRNLLVGRS